MSTPIVSSALALMLTSAPAEQRYLPSTVEVDVELLITQAPDEGEGFDRLDRITSDRTGEQVQKSVQQALEEHGVPIGGDDPSVRIVVTLEWKVFLDSHYIAHIAAHHKDGALKTITLECKLCDEPKLAEMVAQHVPELLPSLEVVDDPPAAVAPPGSGEPQVGEPQPSPVASEADEVTAGEARKIGPLGWAGIATGVAGIAGIAVGAVSLSRGVETMIASDVVDERNADYRPMGRAFVGVGGVFLATGVVFVIVDQTVLKKRRAGRTSIGHLRLPRGGGITIKGRF